ncbi:MAG: hypothetical protein K0R93_534 [Anaerosolibacter sp.]|jgi:uncharacterized protein YqhQ|uniref:DUF1385 domain-containing protein n=1 Tax=Anaerosolibacter sp. TaxID=1872527 RepID=UPI00260B74A8|nr:DUF1385 domain-containing protein [Anaerosolibacter sp.]MDF2545636.1 hypothetical protein [Anaerosolibacter sp.]
MKREDIFRKSATPTSVGGQAVIEGVMMKGPDAMAIAVRKPDGEIVIKKDPVQAKKKSSIKKLPLVRGVFALVESMMLGVTSLTYSAEFWDDGSEVGEKSKLELWIEKKYGDKADDIYIGFSVFIALAAAILLFIIAPTIVTNFMRKMITNTFLLNGVEGIFRIVLFIGYVTLISRMKDIQRVFQYHGAEHKTIHCYEAGKELTVENVRGFTTLHPRCGTSFLVIVMVISMILFSAIGWHNPWVRILSRFILLPIVAGLSYEVIKWAGKSNSQLVYAISYPGLLMQQMTTREPDDRQIEVAIAAMKSVVEEDKEADQ